MLITFSGAGIEAVNFSAIANAAAPNTSNSHFLLPRVPSLVTCPCSQVTLNDEADPTHPSTKRRIAHVKGAPERLIPRCRLQVVDDDIDATQPCDTSFWMEAAAGLSRKGLRCLALCRMDVAADTVDIGVRDITEGDPMLTMGCLVAILDPPRPECIKAISECHDAGIVVKMITGDHPETAAAIGRMLGLVEGEDAEVHTGPQVDAMPDSELSQVVQRCNVFARANPETKIRVVRALQRNGQIASMTGDGVNDAPALKAANIGVAMGITGTDVSKEVG